MAGSFKLRGGDAMRWKIGRVATNHPKEQALAIFQEAEIDMEESKRRCPVDTGTLHDSGHVTKPVVRKGHVSVTMAYGGAAKDYAIPVHEDLEAFHRVGEAKFLESVVNESRRFMGARIRKRIEFNRRHLR